MNLDSFNDGFFDFGNDNDNHENDNQNIPEKSDKLKKFLSPHPSLQYENATLNDIVFNFNLQEFSNRIAFICSLEQNKQLTPEEALCNILKLWEQLKLMRRSFYPRKERKEKELTLDGKKSEDNRAKPEAPTDLAIAKLFYAFSYRVSIICALISGGKVVPLEGYKIIKKGLKRLRKALDNCSPPSW